jgi:hypothetical protein
MLQQVLQPDDDIGVVFHDQDGVAAAGSDHRFLTGRGVLGSDE